MNWEKLLLGEVDFIKRIAIVGILSYILLILVLRISGKRTLSKMNAFDLIITVALGSTFATVIMDTTVAVAEGMAALGLLIGLQYLITWTSVHFPLVGGIVKSAPTLLFHQGEFLEINMKKMRVIRPEMDQAVRNSGNSSYDEVAAIILETDGSMSVLSHDGKLAADLADSKRILQ